MRGIQPSSIVVGVLVDKLAAVLLIGILIAAVGPEAPFFQAAALIVGSLCTLTGGFVAARRAGVRPLLHGAAVGLVGLAISVARFALTPAGAASHSATWELTAWFLVVFSGLAGGFIASRLLAPRAA